MEILQELISDPRAIGHQYYEYKEYYDEHGSREFYHANGTLSFQAAKERTAAGAEPLSIIVFVDASFNKKHVQFRPLLGKILFHLFSYVFNLVKLYFNCFHI